MATTFTATRQFQQTINRQNLNTSSSSTRSSALNTLYHAKMIAQKYNTPLSFTDSDYIYISVVVSSSQRQDITVVASVMNKTSAKTVTVIPSSTKQVDMIIHLSLSEITSDNLISVYASAGTIRSVSITINYKCTLTAQIPSQGDPIRASDINLFLEWISLSDSQNISAGGTISALHVKDQSDVTVHIGVKGLPIYANDIFYAWQQYRNM